MKKHLSYFVLLFISVSLFSCDTEAETPDCKPTEINGSTAPWATYLGHDPTVDFWPGKYINYWVIVVDKTKYPNVGFKVQGDFPNARYMSLNVYDTNRNSTASIYDTQLSPESCSTNPFSGEAHETGGDHSVYTTYIMPESYEEFDNESNVLKFKDDEDELSLILRYYLPEGGDLAGVELPKVEVFDLDTKELVTIPQTTDFLTAWPELLDAYAYLYNIQGSMDNKVRFYKGAARGLYANFDNLYLATHVNFNADEVIMFRWKAVTHANSPEEFNDADVRFYSINIGDDLTNNHDGIADKDLLIDENGYITVVISDNNADVRAKAEEAGFNYLPKTLPKTFDRPSGTIVYRHLLTKDIDTAPYSMKQAPDMILSPTEWSPEFFMNLDASNYMGDYAPSGFRMTKAEYLENFGGYYN
jgi:hypothetical protein